MTTSLDLHGYNQDETRSVLRNFLATACQRYRGQVVHIITGKGRGSSNGSVLRPLVARMLKGELRIFVSDHTLDYNEGGFKVLLK